MFGIEADNVRDAFPRGIDLIERYGEPNDRGKAPVIVVPRPVITSYKYPKQHVLLTPYRDANPGFHLIEALWMLAGRQDAKTLDFYIKDFGKRYGHNGIIPDAYGYRWRSAFKEDQLAEVIAQLRDNRETRQAVLQMWSANHDLKSTVAKPCNLSVMFRIRNNSTLDMTVSNRSNDVLFGLYGANAVHFAILHEYVAAMTGALLGTYYHWSNDFHIYTAEYDKLKRKLETSGLKGVLWPLLATPGEYEKTTPLVGVPAAFRPDLERLWDHLDILHSKGTVQPFAAPLNPFLAGAYYIAAAFAYHKQKNPEGIAQALAEVPMDDWRRATQEWMNRRYERAAL